MIDRIGIDNFFIVVILCFVLIFLFKRFFKKALGIVIIIAMLISFNVLSWDRIQPIIANAFNIGKSVTSGILLEKDVDIPISNDFVDE